MRHSTKLNSILMKNMYTNALFFFSNCAARTKSILLLAVTVLLAAMQSVNAQPAYFNNAGAALGGNSIPLGGNVPAGQCMQSLVAPTEWSVGTFPGNITVLYLRSSTSIVAPTTATYTNFTIKLGQTAATTLTAGVWITAGMTQVYMNPSLTITWPVNTGPNPWVQITLSTPFFFNPAQSLIVEFGHAGMTPATTFFPLGNFAVTGSVRRVWANVPNNPPPGVPTSSGAEICTMGIDIIPAVACTPPTAQPTALIMSGATLNSLTGNFTAASPAPTSYLVVRYNSGATVTNPVNGVSYIAGQSLGLGTVI
ncbi:MAG: hypothetical protein ACHQNT_05100, partial [Bacteroidia bacterium]